MSRTKSAQSIRERWLGFRNRLIANPAFQRRVASFPLTRGLTRRHTARLFDICAQQGGHCADANRHGGLHGLHGLHRKHK